MKRVSLAFATGALPGLSVYATQQFSMLKGALRVPSMPPAVSYASEQLSCPAAGTRQPMRAVPISDR